MLADKGIFAAPTLAASYRAFQRQAAGGKVGIRAGAIPFATRQKNAAMLREAGIRVVVGTDAGASLCRFDEAVHVEMEALVGAGWTPVEAIHAGTLGSATAVGARRTWAASRRASSRTWWWCGATRRAASATCGRWRRCT